MTSTLRNNLALHEAHISTHVIVPLHDLVQHKQSLDKYIIDNAIQQLQQSGYQGCKVVESKDYHVDTENCICSHNLAGSVLFKIGMTLTWMKIDIGDIIRVQINKFALGLYGCTCPDLQTSNVACYSDHETYYSNGQWISARIEQVAFHNGNWKIIARVTDM